MKTTLRAALLGLLCGLLTTLPAQAAVLEYAEGTTIKFNPSATLPGINVGSHAGDPSSLADGDLWYNSLTGKFRARQNGSTTNLIGTGSGSSEWGSITGTLTDQTDLNTALGLKAPVNNAAFTGTFSAPNGTITNAMLADADLSIYAGITPSANVQSLLGAANYAAMLTQLGIATSTGGNAASDSGKYALFDASGNLRGENLLSDNNLVLGSTNTTDSGTFRMFMGNNNTNTGTGAQNIVVLGNNNLTHTSAGYGMLFLMGNQNDFRTTADYGSQGYILANGVQHYGAADSSFTTGYHNRLDGRGTLDTTSTTTLATSAQITGAGGRAMVALGAGTHNYWNGTVALSSHSNVDGKMSLGTLSARSVENGAVPAGDTLATAMKLSQGNDKRLILKPNHLYVFDIQIAAGFTSVQEWCAFWTYRVVVHQGASSTAPLIRSVTLTSKAGGSDSGDVPTDWGVAFTAGTQELVCTLTLDNPTGTDAAWTAHGAFRSVETQANYDGGGGSTANHTAAMLSDITAALAGLAEAGTIDDSGLELDGIGLAGRDTEGGGAMTTIAVGSGLSLTGGTLAAAVDASVFNGNLTTDDDTLPEIAQKLDDLVASVNQAGNYTWTGTHDYTGATVTLGNLTVGDLTATSVLPPSNDGAALGAAATSFSDLFLASGGVINFANGNWVGTHSSGIFTVSTGEFRITTPGTDATSVPTLGSTSTLTNKTLTSPTITTPSAFTTGGTITLAENTGIALDSVLSADGTATGTLLPGTAGATLAFGDLIVLDTTDSRWELADANSASAADGDARGMIGICVLAAASDGDPTTILLRGTVRADTAFPTFTVNAPVYVSETAGDITATSPTTEDNVVRFLGAAITADSIYFNPDSTWFTYDAP